MTSDDRGRLARAAPGGAAGSEALQKLKSGEITLEEYLDTRLERALARLQGRVSDDQRAFLGQMLRDQLATEPLLEEYVRRATGREPPYPAR